MKRALLTASVSLFVAVAAWAQVEPPDAAERGRLDAKRDLGGAPVSLAWDADANRIFVSAGRRLHPVDPDSVTTGGPGFELMALAPPEVKDREVRQLSVAPGGALAAVVFRRDGAPAVDLIDLATNSRTPLVLPGRAGLPAQVDVELGFRGNVILTEVRAASDAPERVPEWIFWDPQGRVLGRFLAAPRIAPRIAPDGRGAVFLLGGGAVVKNERGRTLRTIPGSFRKVAVSNGGKQLLLNPANKTGKVLSVTRGACELHFDDPVHGVQLSPGGRIGVAWFGDGRFVEFDPATCARRRTLRIPGTIDPFVASVLLQDGGRMVVGISERSSADGEFDHGRVLGFKYGMPVWKRGYSFSTAASAQPIVEGAGDRRYLVRTVDGVSVLKVPAHVSW